MRLTVIEFAERYRIKEAVYTHFSGSVCVVELTPGALRPGSNGTYIDVQRRGSLDRIDLIRGGQVKQRFFEYIKNAPERIIALIKENNGPMVWTTTPPRQQTI